MPRHRATLAALLLPAAAAAQLAEDVPVPFRDILADRAAQCAELERGTLTVEDGAVRQVDLTGDGAPNWVLDEARLTCSSAASTPPVVPVRPSTCTCPITSTFIVPSRACMPSASLYSASPSATSTTTPRRSSASPCSR